ncbi:hypothetical protein QQX98_006186 [Neonectria punicea]|uniref:1,3-beta-glucanosyltransferase n=1 Tax=Neonectria punicea TaxID=979145 RepID=A0ABR1H1U5_9HYPO
MVGNTLDYGTADRTADMNAAKAAGIDAFALNIAYSEEANALVNLAFSIATSVGFKLFFSFDYAGNGFWPNDNVISLINAWKGYDAYYKRGSQPLASTFEGSGAADQWATIKSATGCFFVPDYSSLMRVLLIFSVL